MNRVKFLLENGKPCGLMLLKFHKKALTFQ